MKNYDPNFTSMSRMAIQRVILKFQLWEYTHSVTVEVGGNCTGLTVIKSAVGILYDRLIEGLTAREVPSLTLKNGKNTLLCEDEDDRGEEWLQEMLVSAEIKSIKVIKT